MRKFVIVRFCFLLLLAVQPVLAQQTGEIRLIIRGDDMGMAHAVNEAIIASYRDGVMKTVEIMVPTPWFPEAVAMLRENPDLDVGVHLVLTSEWEALKWRPLTHAPSLVDEDGYFFPMIWPNENYPASKALAEQDWKLDEIEREFRAQIELAGKNIPQVSHLTCHMGCNRLSDEVDALVKRLGEEYGLNIDLEELGVESTGGYDGPSETPEEKVDSFIRMLEKLQPGVYMFLDHPGRNTPEMQAIYHIGYEDVAIDREGVTKVFTDPRVRAVLERRKIEVISYADLRK